MYSYSFIREKYRKEADESRGFPTLTMEMIVEDFHIEGRECEDRERLKM